MMTIRFVLRCALSVLLLNLLGASLGAQAPSAAAAAQATLRVTVRDMSGVIPSASVTLVRSDAPLVPVARALTDGNGVATFQALTAGTYERQSHVHGFRRRVADRCRGGGRSPGGD